MPGRAKLFIDGQNFLEKIKAVFQYEHTKRPPWSQFDFRALFASALQSLPVDERVIYFAKISEHPETLEKSRKLIEERRLLKNRLEQQGFRYVHAGHVRGDYARPQGGRPPRTFPTQSDGQGERLRAAGRAAPWVDGVYVNVRLEDESNQRQCLLVIIAAMADGRKELLVVAHG
jgi:hypothetical protein